MAYGFKIHNASITGYGSIPSIDLTLTQGETIINKQLVWDGDWYVDSSHEWGLSQEYEATYFDGNVTTEAGNTPVLVNLSEAAAEASWGNFIVTVNDDIVLPYDDNLNIFDYNKGTYILEYTKGHWQFVSAVAGTYALKVVDPYAESGTPYLIIESDFESTDVGDEYSISISETALTEAFASASEQIIKKIIFTNSDGSWSCDTEYDEVLSRLNQNLPTMAIIKYMPGGDMISQTWMSEYYPIGAEEPKPYAMVTSAASAVSVQHDWLYLNSDNTVSTGSDHNMS